MTESSLHTQAPNTQNPRVQQGPTDALWKLKRFGYIYLPMQSVMLSTRTGRFGGIMASWMLDCANCHKTFQHSEIEDTLTNRYLPAAQVP